MWLKCNFYGVSRETELDGYQRSNSYAGGERIGQPLSTDMEGDGDYPYVFS